MEAQSPSRRPVSPSRTAGAIAVLVILVAAVIGTGTWAVLESRRSLRERVLDGNLTAAQIAVRVIETELRGHLQVVEGFARRSSLRAAVLSADWPATVRHLKELREVDSDVGSAVVVDARGVLHARDPFDPTVVGRDFSFRDWFTGASRTEGAYLSEAYVQTGTPRAFVVAVARAIRDPSGRIRGILQVTIPVSRLDVLAAGVRIPLGGSLQIFDQNGHALTGGASAPDSTFRSFPIVFRALSGRSGVGEFDVPGREGKRLAAFAPVAGARWGVVVEEPEAAANRPVVALTSRLALIVGIVFAVVLGGAFVVSRLLRRLAREHGRSVAILTSIADGAVVTDAEGKITTINPALERLAGWSQREVVGRRYTDVYQLFDERERRVEVGERYLTQALESGRAVVSRGYELYLCTRDGGRVPIAVASAPVLDHAGTVVAGVAVLRDVSYEHEVDQLKSSFVSMVSHELRTPLTMIQGFSELLISRDLGPERSREALERINTAAMRLSRLIDDLLAVARLESGTLVLRREQVDLPRLVSEVIGSFADQDEREFKTDLDPDLSTVYADADKLVQVLTNLLSNAVKYSPEGAPVVVRARRNGAAAEVSVEDRGPGLTEEEIGRLFGKFVRIDRADLRRVGGTGLGLYITKSLVEMQGGDIWVRSEPGRGSAFTFSLPLRTENGDS